MIFDLYTSTIHSVMCTSTLLQILMSAVVHLGNLDIVQDFSMGYGRRESRPADKAISAGATTSGTSWLRRQYY